MKSFIQLKKSLKKDTTHLKKIKVAILGDTATQFLAKCIKATFIDHGYHLDLYEADYNQIERQILDTSSTLYEFAPEVIIIFQSSHKLLSKYNKMSQEERSIVASNEIDKIKNLTETLSSHSNAKIIFYNYTEIDDSIYGNFANSVSSSFLYQLRKLNYQLMELSSNTTNLFICDLSSLQNEFGKKIFFDPLNYIGVDMVMSLKILPYVASKTVDLINAFQGKIIKCVIIDLDNTTWGGIIGDDGIENIQIGELGAGKAFTEFQHWIKKLKDRGIIVAVCSKNSEPIAKLPFEKHPEMVLKLDDISCFIANWENKADNIREIQSILNIGFDSMVFIDDNPFERNIVRENLPDIIVPELPENPAQYLEHLYSLNLFETISSSKEDAERTKLYQREVKRVSSQKTFTNVGDFLKNLKMKSEVKSFDTFNTPRVAQLSQRSNQFNLRTVRYTEADIKDIISSDKYFSFSFTLEDRFGDNGIVCVIVLKKINETTLFIENWFMSCRVLKRGMEDFALNKLVAFALKHKYTTLEGEYIKTLKNRIVENHYSDLGFEKYSERFLLDVINYSPRKTYISTP